MATRRALFLHEELMLLALRDDEGTVFAGSLYQYALGGAVLAELMMGHRIEVEDSKKKLVNLVSPEPFGDALIDECLERVATAKRRASLSTWATRFSTTKKLKERVARQLCRRGILKEDEKKVLLIFTQKIYPEVDPGPERGLLRRLRDAIFTDTARVDPRTAVLVSLAHAADMLKRVFDKRELRERKQRIKKITAGEMTGKATKEAIDAMIMVTTIMPAVIVTSTSH